MATPLLTYASLYFSHLPAGVLGATAYLLAAANRDTASRRRTAQVAGAGLLAACAVVTEYPAAILAGSVASMVLLDRQRLTLVPVFLAGFVAGLTPLIVYNVAAWGDALATGYAFKASAEHAAVHGRGFFGVAWPSAERLFGVLLGAQRGLLYYAPIVACGAIGLVALWARDRRQSAVLGATVLAYLAFAAGFVDWQGGWSAAARHLTPILPLLLIPIAEGLGILFRRTWSAALAAVLTGWSLSATILSVAITPFFPEYFSHPLGQIAIRSLADGLAFRNIVSDLLGVPPLAVLVGYAGALVAVAFIALRQLTPARHRRLVLATCVVTVLLHPLIMQQTAPTPTIESEYYRGLLLERLGYAIPVRTASGG